MSHNIIGHNRSFRFLLRLGPLIILALAALYLTANWASIPEHFLNHWDMNGRGNASWTDRSFGSVFGVLVVAGGIVVFINLVLFISGTVMSQKRFITPITMAGLKDSAKVSLSDDAKWALSAVQWYLWVASYIVAITLGFLSAWVPFHASLPGTRILVICSFVGTGLVLVLGGFLWMISYVALTENVQAQQKAAERAQDKSSGNAAMPAANAKGWKLGGFIYVDSDDPSIWVPKQIGVGWTPNLANPKAWIFLCTLLAALTILIFAVGFITHLVFN